MRVLLLAPPGAGKGTQGERLAARLGVTLHAVVYLYAPDTVLTRRLLARAGQEGRADDTTDVIRHRLQVFAETTGPLVAYYQERGILVAVDADQPPDSVTAEIQARLSELALPRRSGLRRSRLCVRIRRWTQIVPRSPS